MKKLTALFLALAMMFVMVLPAAASPDPYYSPEATAVNGDNQNNQGGQNGSSTSPQTDSFNWMVLVAGGAGVSLCAALIAGKKLRDSSEEA